MTFANIIRKRGGDTSLLAYRHLEVLEKMYSNHRKITGDILPVISNKELLFQYCEDHPLDKNINSDQVIRNSGHHEIAEAVAEVIFGGKPTDKVKCVWIYGERDSGKSTVIEFIEEILCS